MDTVQCSCQDEHRVQRQGRQNVYSGGISPIFAPTNIGISPGSHSPEYCLLNTRPPALLMTHNAWTVMIADHRRASADKGQDEGCRRYLTD